MTGSETALPVAPVPASDFVVVDVETACSKMSSICQIGTVGFRDSVEVFDQRIDGPLEPEDTAPLTG